MNVLAIIPARGGSKGIPRKNLIEVAGKPLIQWTIEAALESEIITEIVVSSDDEEILSFSKGFENIICIKRPVELAQDNSPTVPVMIHAINQLKDQFDYVVLLQPTSPLRNSKDIDDAFDVLVKSNGNSLISVVQPEHHPYKSFKRDNNGFLSGIINNEFPFTPRQELPEVYQPNGAIYIIEKDVFLEFENLFTQNTIPFSMPPNKSLDIDTEEDLEKITALLI